MILLNIDIHAQDDFFFFFFYSTFAFASGFSLK